MRGLKINFTTGGPVFDFSTPVFSFDTTVQNALVSLGTVAGSDTVYPDRGTTLQIDAARGLMVNQSWANHTANFAALAVLAFSQNTDVQSNPFKLQTFKLASTGLIDQRAVLNVFATGSDGSQSGLDVVM